MEENRWEDDGAPVLPVDEGDDLYDYDIDRDFGDEDDDPPDWIEPDDNFYHDGEV